MAQTFPDYEVIIADDSGTAVAREIVAARRAEAVRYRPNPTTLGVVRSLRQAAQSARGEFIIILNDDDYWEKDLLAALVQPLLADPRRVLAFCDHWVVNSEGRVEEALSRAWSECFGRAALPEGELRDPVEFALVKKGLPLAIAALFRRDAFDWALLVPEVAGAYDYWLACVIAATRKPLYYVPQRLAWYRVHPAMETCRRAPDKADSTAYLLSTLRQRGWFPEWDHFLRTELAEVLLAAGRDKLYFNRVGDARRDWWRSFCLQHRAAVLVRVAVTFLPGPLRVCLGAAFRTARRWSGLRAEPEPGNPLRSDSFKPSS